MDIAHLVERNARTRARSAAYICDDECYTWAAVEERSSRLAAALLQSGLRQGDRVALIGETCHRYWESHFACAKAGLIGVPLNHRLLGRELADIVADSQCRAWIAGASVAERAHEANSEAGAIMVGWGKGHGCALDYEQAIKDSPHLPADRPEADRTTPNVIGYTSGTTGRAKGAVLPHHAAVMAAFSFAAQWAITDRDTVLACLPAYVYRAGGGGLAPAVVGAPTVLTPFEPGRVLELVGRHRITTAMIAPAMLRLLLDHEDIRRWPLSSLRSLWSTGAPVQPEVLDRVIAHMGDVIGSMYGMTEATGIAMARHRVADIEANPGRRLSAGRPLPTLDVGVFGADGSTLPAGDVGEVRVRGETVMCGYWNDPEKTAAALVDGWLHTGDMGKFDDEGYLYLVDRRADVINSGGINVYSLEVENAIAAVRGVREAAVVGVPDDRWGEAVAVYIVSDRPDSVRADQVLAHCRATLASFKKPRHVFFVPDLPRNAMGKVDKPALRNQAWKGRERMING